MRSVREERSLAVTAWEPWSHPPGGKAEYKRQRRPYFSVSPAASSAAMKFVSTEKKTAYIYNSVVLCVYPSSFGEVLLKEEKIDVS